MGKKDFLKQNKGPAAIPFTADVSDREDNTPGVRPEHFTNISTHENVSLFYENAGIATRYSAYFIDVLVRAVFWIALGVIFYYAYLRDYIVGNKEIEATDDFFNRIVMIAMIIYFSIFFVRLLYFILFEGIMRGRTPGKSAMGITVVSVSGEAPTVSQIVVRNLMRFLHMIPGGELADGIVAVCSKKAQRLGDMAAGTMVIKVRKLKGVALPAAADSVTDNSSVENGKIPGSYSTDGFLGGIDAIENAEKEEADFLAEMKERLRREYSASSASSSETVNAQPEGEENGVSRQNTGIQQKTGNQQNAYADQGIEQQGIVFQNDTLIPGGFLTYGDMLMLGNYLYSRHKYTARDVYDYKFTRLLMKKSGAEIPKTMFKEHNLLYLQQTYNYHYQQWEKAKGGGTYGGNV